MEKINDYNVALEIIKANLNKLEDIIRDNTKVDLKLEISVISNKRIELISQELLNQLGDSLSKIIFKSIKFVTWGGCFQTNENRIWFNPKLSYTHPSNGSNGCDFCNSIWFDFDKNEWIVVFN